MTREELETMLNEMDPEERELALAADDAADRLWSYRLKKEYGVQEVICNPDDDRTKIMLDGVVMDQEQFEEWLANKEMEKIQSRLNLNNSDSDNSANDLTEATLPNYLEVTYEELQSKGYTRAPLPSDIKKYLRRAYGHCLARDNNMTINIQDDDRVVYIDNIEWGRKLTNEELDTLNHRW